MSTPMAGSSSGAGPTKPTSTLASCTWSCSVSRASWVRVCVCAVTGGFCGPRTMGPKYFATSGLTSSGLKSPTMAREALLGA